MEKQKSTNALDMSKVKAGDLLYTPMNIFIVMKKDDENITLFVPTLPNAPKISYKCASFCNIWNQNPIIWVPKKSNIHF